MDTPPQISAPPQNSSVYHKAASYAVLAVPGSIVANIVLGGATAAVSPGVRSVIMLIPGFVLFSAVPAGAFALFGIRRYGIRTLLWKGLFGVLVPVALFGCAILAFQHVRESAPKKAQQWEQKQK
jgi:hypothetical protein